MRTGLFSSAQKETLVDVDILVLGNEVLVVEVEAYAELEAGLVRIRSTIGSLGGVGHIDNVVGDPLALGVEVVNGSLIAEHLNAEGSITVSIVSKVGNGNVLLTGSIDIGDLCGTVLGCKITGLEISVDIEGVVERMESGYPTTLSI